ncbi:MAG: T9SS type A sorting domain-containing protein, partial [Bacteroidales bacterium]|nr:T9SS type A sorting domain-containing protein [Bacteroidales bacterium]
VVIRKSVVRKVVTMDTIAYLSSNNNTYTDTLPAKGTQAYYVGMVLPEEINPMTQFMKAESGPFSIALSNIAEVESDGPDAVYDLSGSNAKAYAWGHTIYVKGAKGEDVAVYDVKGRKIDAAEGQDEYEFNVRLDGVYFVKVGEYTFKVVVE